MKDQETTHITRGALVMFIAIFGISAAWALRAGDTLLYPDEIEYNSLAVNLAQGRGYVNEAGQATAFRPPGYPYLLSLIYQFWERPLAAKIANALFLTLTAVVLYFLIAPYCSNGAVVVLLLILFYPVFIYSAGTLYPQIFGALIFSLSVFLLTDHPASAKALWFSGLLFGVLVLTIPAFLLVCPVLVAFLAVANRNSFFKGVWSVTCFLVCVVLVVGPWTIRNAIYFKSFIPVSSNSGENLLLGNSENTRPNSGVNVDISRYTSNTQHMNEAEKDAYLTRCALDWIRGHPVAAFKLYVQKVVNYFNYANELYVASESSSLRNWVVLATYYPLLALAIIRLAFFRRHRLNRTEGLLYVLYFASAFLSAIFFTRIRFRIPFDVLLVAIDGMFIGYLWTSWSRKKKPSRSKGS